MGHMNQPEMAGAERDVIREGKRSPELTKLLAAYKVACADARTLDELAEIAQDSGSMEVLLDSNPNPKKPKTLPQSIVNAEGEFRNHVTEETIQ